MILFWELIKLLVFCSILYLAWEGAKSVFHPWLIELKSRYQDLQKKKALNKQQITLVFSIGKYEKGVYATIPKVNPQWGTRVVWVYTSGKGESAFELPILVLESSIQPQ